MALANRHTPPNIRRPMGRGNKITAIVIAAFAILGTLVPAVIAFYTDWLWFGEVEYRPVFNTTVLTRLALFAGFGLLAWVVFFLNGKVIFRNRPQTFTNVPELEAVQRAVSQATGKLLMVVPIILAVISGAIAQQQWRTFLLFFNRQDFGITDPQFGVDYGFYAFTLPVLSMLANALSTMLIVAFVMAIIAHYVLGAITVADPTNGRKASITRPARMHLAVLAGLWMLLRVGILWLDRFYLLMNDHGIFTGGSYTDINATLPAKLILMVIAAVVAASFFAAIVLRDLRIPAMATVLMLLSSLVIGTAWPLMMDRFSVTPNRAEKESEYISRNIEATRYAFGISDDKVTYQREWGTGATNEAVANDAATVSNIRLLDPEIISETFTQQRQLKNFYSFPVSLAMDRYEVDGQMRDFVVAAREINPNELKGNQADWINRHTVYTHGNGFVAAQANQVDEVARDVGSSRGGYPVYAVSDLQTTDEVAKSVGIEVTEPRVYYGPVISSATDGADYAVVGTDGGPSVEYDTDTSTYTYQGKGGVAIGNVVQRAVFAARYQEMNLILSDRVNANSRILFDRDPRSRVHKVAPWLSTDATTYPAVIDGRIKWIVDGYTTLASLPYVTRQSMSQSTMDSSAASVNSQGQIVTDRVAYIRNSVKAVVDAYDGTVELYAFDESDPVLKAWQGAFPGTVKPRSEISEELMNHIRYPEDMFKVQRAMLARYHVSDAREFFTADRFWSVPEDPSGTDSESSGSSQPPYYVVAADPETGEPSFQLITAFRGLERQFLAAHMSASSDPENFGQITVRVLPTSSQTFGPKQAQDSMMSSDQVARDQTLWKNSNDLLNGGLLTLPVGGGEILYVEPIYAKRKDQESAFPKLLRVLVFYKEQVGYAPTISEALAQVGIDPKEAQDLQVVEGDATVTTPDTATTTAPAEETPPAETPAAEAPSISQEEAARNLNTALENLRNARGGTHEEYGRALDALDKAVADFQATQQ